MPELPEVDLVTRHLGQLVLGRRILQALLIRERLSPFSSPEEFAGALAGTGISRVHRRGKHILLELDNGRTLITHLRMSGRFVLQPEELPAPKFSHARFVLEGGDTLHFADQRHFGMMKVVETASVFDAREIACLAPEPFSDDFSPEYLHTALKRSSRSIKEFLLDQTKVCGLGNIYAAEALFLSGINPKMRADRISKPRADSLHAAIRGVLSEAIELSMSVPLCPENVGGNFYGESADGEWRVYGREGEPCVVCERIVVRLKQGGRSTFYCPNCQKR